MEASQATGNFYFCFISCIFFGKIFVRSWCFLLSNTHPPQLRAPPPFHESTWDSLDFEVTLGVQTSWELKNVTPPELKDDGIIKGIFLIWVACNCRFLCFFFDFHLNVISVHIDPKAFVCCISNVLCDTNMSLATIQP